MNEQENQAQKEQRTNFVLSDSDGTDIVESFPLTHSINLSDHIKRVSQLRARRKHLPPVINHFQLEMSEMQLVSPFAVLLASKSHPRNFIR